MPVNRSKSYFVTDYDPTIEDSYTKQCVIDSQVAKLGRTHDAQTTCESICLGAAAIVHALVACVFAQHVGVAQVGVRGPSGDGGMPAAHC